MEALLQKTVHEDVTGYLVDLGDGKAELLVGSNELEDETPVLASGPMVVRYAIPMLYESHLAFVPAHVIAERGGELTGWPAWKFIFKRFELHPRAEVFGLRSDGKTDQLYLKTLDIAAPVRVYAYNSVSDSVPLAQVISLVVDADLADEVSERLNRYVIGDDAEQ
jgi:hypothetical protein